MKNLSSVQTVLSASRRTDIPAFYMDWFMAGIEDGLFGVVNPYNSRTRIIPADFKQIHTIVFWSKNFGPFLEGGYGESLLQMGYHLFFNFTVNSEDALLEPNLPPLAQRLGQLKILAQRFEARRIYWRFDPICFYRIDNGPRKNNLKEFLAIADTAAACGIPRCITSFLDIYRKVERRAAAIPGLTFIDPAIEEKRDLLLKMGTHLKKRGMALSVCCEKDILATLPPGSEIAGASCIPNDLFLKYDGGRLSTHKDAGQRVKAGCGCRESVDIGNYRQHPCYHNCLFCYANPMSPRAQRPGQ